MTVALAQAIQSRRLFHVKVLGPCAACPDAAAPNYPEALTLEQLHDLRRRLHCDAVLLGRVHSFRPHPATRVGLFLRLLDVNNGRLVWAVDHVWDTTDAETECRIERFFRQRMRSGYEPMEWQLAMISPRVFAKFVAHEVAATLPDAAELDKRNGRRYRRPG
jgi:hypothetical protein